MSDVSKHWDNEPDKHTLIKSEIASKYFSTWAAIIGRQTDHLTYLDLYAGRGKHDNGELSTAIKIVLRASKESILRKNLRILLNDKELDNIKDTKKVLADLDIEKEFLHKPIITNLTVDEFTPDLIGETGFSSTFCFIDPFGYKGLTVDLIRSVIKEWGCDCLIFFNFNRINLDLEKPNAERDMNLLFGSDNFSNIICQIKRYQKKRESIILEAFRRICLDIGVKYFLPFRMNFEKSNKTSHYLIFMTKHVLGFAKMKETMAKYCNQFEDGIPLYVYIEGYENKTDILNLNIIGPKEDLKNSMMNDFSKKVVSVRNIIDFYNELGLFYIEKNIRSALIELESENRIEDCTPNAKKRRKGTFSDKRIVRFLK